MFQHFFLDDQTKPSSHFKIFTRFNTEPLLHPCIVPGLLSYDSWDLCFLQQFIFNLTETTILYKMRYLVSFVFFLLVPVCEMRSLALILIEIIIGLAAFRFETQSKVWRSSLIFPWQKLHPKTEFISLLDFWKNRFGKICISIHSFTLSLFVNWFGASSSRLGRNKSSNSKCIFIKNVFPITDVLDCGDLSVHFSYETCN